ncbi:hypothetical protein FRC00_002192 [Tulasnella sp. 408]|nr:hypothetical protein FRC00_002192 [Tulasnella sp. 408]
MQPQKKWTDRHNEGPEDEAPTPPSVERTANNPIKLPDGPTSASNVADVGETPANVPIIDLVGMAEHLTWVKHEQYQALRPNGAKELQDLLSDAPAPGAEAVRSTKREGVGSGEELSKKPKLIEGDIEF